jgi:hypothetical protein
VPRSFRTPDRQSLGFHQAAHIGHNAAMRHGLAALVASAVALAAPAPAAAEQPSRNPAAEKGGRSLVGLPLFSSDGKRIGRILAGGTAEGREPVLVAEIERPHGIRPHAVAIPLDMIVRRAGRVELTITAAEIEKRLSQAGRER